MYSSSTEDRTQPSPFPARASTRPFASVRRSRLASRIPSVTASGSASTTKHSVREKGRTATSPPSGTETAWNIPREKTFSVSCGT